MAVVGKDCWSYHIDINKLKNGKYSEFESRLIDLQDEVLNRNCFRIQKYGHNDVQSLEDNLERLYEENKLLRSDIDAKLNEVTKQKNLYDTYKQDQKLLSKEIKDTHEAFLMAKKYYKKHAKIYYTIESRNGDKHTIYLQFFTEAKKDTDQYSVHLLRDIKTGHFELLATKPKLTNIAELNKSLKQTNDIPGILCTIRQSFLKMKANKQEE